MRLIPRHRNRQRAVAPRIAISQAEITADLHYRGGAPSTRDSVAAGRRGSAR
jgi:hypothetical protein